MPTEPSPVRLTFSTQSFGLYAIASAISLPLLNLNGNFNDSQLLFGVGLAVTALTGLLIFLIDAVTLRIRLELEISSNNRVMVALIALIGLLRGYFSYFGLNLLDFPQYADLPIRLVTSTSTTLLWLTLSTYLISMKDQFKIEFDIFLRKSFAALSKFEPSQLRKIPQSLSSEIQDIEAQIQKSLSQAYEPFVSQEKLISASQQIRDCIETSIRPLSHRLWAQASKTYPRISIWGLLREALNRQEFSIIMATAFISLLSLFNLTTSIGFSRALLATTITSLICSIYFVIQRGNFPQIAHQSMTLKLLNLSTPGLLLSGIFYLINRYIFLADLGILNFIFTPICFCVFLIASTISVARDDQNRFLRSLQSNMSSRIDNFKGNQELESGKQVAAFLHNSVQSELLALSYQLEDLSRDPESNETKAALEKLASTLTAQIGKNFENFNEKPTERVETLKSAWAGIAEIDFESEFSTIASFKRVHDVVQVIEEAITNAVRSANATRIEISWIQPTDGELILSIIDNGERTHHEVAGLGTQWLNDIAFGRWSRSETNDKTILTVTFNS